MRYLYNSFVLPKLFSFRRKTFCQIFIKLSVRVSYVQQRWRNTFQGPVSSLSLPGRSSGAAALPIPLGTGWLLRGESRGVTAESVPGSNPGLNVCWGLAMLSPRDGLGAREAPHTCSVSHRGFLGELRKKFCLWNTDWYITTR